MTSRILAIVVAPLAAGVFSAARADDAPAREAALYVRAGAGVVFGGDLAQDLSYNPDIVFIGAPANAKATDLGSGLAVSAAIGFQYPAGTRTELEYRRMNAKIDGIVESGCVTIICGAVPTTEDFRVEALMSNVYVDLAPGRAISPFIGAGVGGAFARNELGERDSAFAYQARAGVEVALGRKLALSVEAVYLRTLDLSFGPDAFEPGGPAGPRADGDAYSSLSALAGLRATF